MKKTKLSVGLVTTFIATLGLSACATATVTEGDGAVVTITGYDGTEVKINADYLYGEYLKDPSKVSSFYDSVVENLLRYTYKETSFVADNNAQGEKLLKTYGKIASDSALAVRKAKEKAQSNAKSNKTDYATEWDAILKENGVETEDELKETYIYKYEKEEYERWFLKSQVEDLKKEYIGIQESEKAASKFPYHVRHILVKVDGGASDFTRGTIVKDEAENLASVMSELTDETKVGQTNQYLYPFGAVAKKHAEQGDQNSANKGGDLGIVTTSTAFVNEFKLGMYAFDALLSGQNHSGSQVTLTSMKKGVGITEEVEAYFTKDAEGNPLSIKKVPYDAFIQIGKVADVTQDEDKLDVNDGATAYYPRNILWNNYLNLHEPFVITNQKLDPATGFVGTETSTSSRFNSEGLLTDEDGRIIFGVRSEHGIHLIVMQKSIFNDELGAQSDVTLSEYYTTYTPDSPKYPSSNGTPKTTYVNYMPGLEDKDLESRANEVEGEIKSFDSSYSYRYYEHLKGYLNSKNVSVTYTNDLDKVIDTYVATLRTTNKNNTADDLADAWDTYINLLKLEDYNRNTVVRAGQTYYYTVDGEQKSGQVDTTRLVSPVCAVSFQKAKSDDNYKEGGICYVKK